MSGNTLNALLNRAGTTLGTPPHGYHAAFSTVLNERADCRWREAGHKGASPDRAILNLMLVHIPNCPLTPRVLSGRRGAQIRCIKR